MHPEQHDIVNLMEKGRVKKKKSIKKSKNAQSRFQHYFNNLAKECINIHVLKQA